MQYHQGTDPRTLRPQPAAMNDQDRYELMGRYIAQGWHFEPAYLLATRHDAANRLALFRLTDAGAS